MAVRRILLLGEKILREPGLEVEAFDDELRTLVEDMLETMYYADGIGLAAPQVGVSLRVCVLDLRDEDDPDGGRWVLVNPVIVESSDEENKAPEGCLSIPEMEDVVTRAARVTVQGATPSNGSSTATSWRSWSRWRWVSSSHRGPPSRPIPRTS